MTNKDNEGRSADAKRELDQRWKQLTVNLAAYLATMVDPGERDHLILKLPGAKAGQGAWPYVQFAAFGGGTMLRAEASSNGYLAPAFHLDPASAEVLCLLLGWQGGEDDNFNLHRPVAEAQALAEVTVETLRDYFNIPDPGLLAVEAWGPAAVSVGILGLSLNADVPSDVVDLGVDDAGRVDLEEYIEPPAGWATSQLAVVPENHSELVGFVRDVLVEMYQEEPELDSDGDFVLVHMRQRVWVRPRKDQPCVEIMARVVHDVHSRRATAVELGILNRDVNWVKWTLRKREVWQTLLVPGKPFVASHVRELIEVFLASMSRTRDDLVVRTGGRVA